MWEKCNTSGGLRGLWGLLRGKTWGRFGGRAGRVWVPFFYRVVVGKVWEINGLWEDSGEGPRLDRIREL